MVRARGGGGARGRKKEGTGGEGGGGGPWVQKIQDQRGRNGLQTMLFMPCLQFCGIYS